MMPRLPVTLLTLQVLIAFTGGCEVPELEAPAQRTEQDTAETAVVTPATAPITPEPSAPREVTGLDPQQGKLSREAGGYLGVALGAGMYARHQVVFLQVKNALNLDYGLHGAYPRSHAEFMQRVIQTNNIQLPELEEGDAYLYDPTDHTLKISRPAK